MKRIRLLSGSSHPDLAHKIALRIGVPVTPTTIKRMESSERDIDIHVSVRNYEVFIVQTGNCFLGSIDEFLIELLILTNACKNASAGKIVAILPYFPYSRYGKKDSPRGPITANLIAQMLQTSGINHVLTMDLHSQPIQDFFDIPVDNLKSEPLIAKALFSFSLPLLSNVEPFNSPSHPGYISPSCKISNFSFMDNYQYPVQPAAYSTPSSQFTLTSTTSSPNSKLNNSSAPSILYKEQILHNSLFQDNCVLVAPSPAATKMVASLADRLNIDFTIVTFVNKDDESQGTLIGNVNSKLVWMFTDIIDDPTSFISTSKLLRNAGALLVGIIAIHPLLSHENIDLLEKSTDIDLVLCLLII